MNRNNGLDIIDDVPSRYLQIRVHHGNDLDFCVKTYYSNFKMEI